MSWSSINDPFCGHSYSVGNGVMDLDPWRSPSVGEVVEEAHDASCLMKNPLDPHLLG